MYIQYIALGVTFLIIYIKVFNPNQKYSELFHLESTFTLCIIRYGKRASKPEFKIRLANLASTVLAQHLTSVVYINNLSFICSEVFQFLLLFSFRLFTDTLVFLSDVFWQGNKWSGLYRLNVQLNISIDNSSSKSSSNSSIWNPLSCRLNNLNLTWNSH